MKNYKDRFTDDELNYLRTVLLRQIDEKTGEVLPWDEKHYTWEDHITPPELLLSIWEKITEIYEETPKHQTEVPDTITAEERAQVVADDIKNFGGEVLKALFVDELTHQPADALALFDENVTALVITNEKYYGALRPQKNDTAYVINIDKQLCFSWDKNGEPIITTVDEQTLLDGYMERDEIPADCADTELLEIFAAAVASAYMFNMRDRITVNYPSFFKAMRTKTGKGEHKHYDVMERIKRLENIGGVLVEQKKLQRVFIWVEIDEDNKTLTFESPYLYSIMDLLRKEPAYIAPTRKNDKPASIITGVSLLGNGAIASAKNKITAEITQYIQARIHQHGRTTVSKYAPDKEYKDRKLVKVEITYKEIIENCPRLSEALRKSPHGTQILQRSILGTKYNDNKRSKTYHPTTLLEEYMRRYTSIFDYWKDFKISKIQDITVKNLNNKIIFTHHGYNGDFKNPYHLPEIDGKGVPEIL